METSGPKWFLWYLRVHRKQQTANVSSLCWNQGHRCVHPPYRFSTLNWKLVTAHMTDCIGESGAWFCHWVLRKIWLRAERSHWIIGLNNSWYDCSIHSLLKLSTDILKSSPITKKYFYQDEWHPWHRFASLDKRLMKIIRLIKIIDHMDHFFDFFGGGDAKFLPGELFLTLTTRPYLEFCSSEPESC